MSTAPISDALAPLIKELEDDLLELQARRALDKWVLAKPPEFEGPRAITLAGPYVYAWKSAGHSMAYSAKSHVELARMMGLIP